MPAHDLILPIGGFITDMIGGFTRMQQSQDRIDNPPVSQRSRIGTVGGTIKPGGFGVSDSATLAGIVADDPELFANLGNVMREERPGLFGTPLGGTPAEYAPVTAGNPFNTLADLNEITTILNKEGRFEEAALIAGEFNKLLGGEQSLTPGAMDVAKAAGIDADEYQKIFDAQFVQKGKALDFTREQNDKIAGIGQRYDQQSLQALQSSVQAEGLAVNSLNSGRLQALQQLGEARSLRAQMLDSFSNRSAQEFESLKGGLDFRQENETENLQNRLANDPAFQGRPDLIEAQMRDLKFSQRRELGGIAADISAKQEQLRQNVDLNSAQLVQGAGITAAQQFSNLAVQESSIRNLFAGRRTQVQMNRAQNGMTISMLEREGRLDEADQMRNLTRDYIPRADIVREAMGINIAAEDKERANKFAGEEGIIQGITQVSGGFKDAASYFQRAEEIEAQRQAQKDANKTSMFGAGAGAAGSIAGAVTTAKIVAPGCVDESCEVVTPDGPMPIGLVSEGDLVMGASGGFRMIVAKDHGYVPPGERQEYVTIEAGDASVTITTNHPIAGRPAGEYAVGDKIGALTVTAIMPHEYAVGADIMLEGNEDYVVGGIAVQSVIGAMGLEKFKELQNA